MSGIDRQRVVGKSDEELDELTCGICQDILTDPVVTQCCRQTYCTACIHQWLIDNNTCPNDRKTLQLNGLTPAAKMVINLLNKLKVKCENHGFGCETISTIEEMSKHMKICDKNCKSCEKLRENNIKSNNEIKDLKKQLTASRNEVKELRDQIDKMKVTPENTISNQVSLMKKKLFSNI